MNPTDSPLPPVSVIRYGDGAAQFDVSIVITFHREGLHAKWMLDGFQRVREHAENAGLGMQLVCVLDHPDDDTLGLVSTHPILVHNDWVLTTRTGDPGTNRNIGVAYAGGEYIGVADGDDYYSEGWVTAGHALASRYGASVVVHPEYVVSFESQHVLARLVDQRDGTYPLASCLLVHPWVCSAIGHASIFKTTPYLPTNARETGFGFEDWHWNLEVLAKGVWHVLARDTALYYRRKKTSVLVSESAYQAIVRPTPFFDHPERWVTAFPLLADYARHTKDIPVVGSRRSDLSDAACGAGVVLSADDFPVWVRRDIEHFARQDVAFEESTAFYGRFHRWSPPVAPELGEIYAALFSKIPSTRYDAVMIVPWLGDHGTGKVLLRYLRYCAKKSVRFLVVSTSDVFRSTADSRIELDILDFGSAVSGVGLDARSLLLGRVLLQLHPRLIRSVNSDIGELTCRRYARPLKAESVSVVTTALRSWMREILSAARAPQDETLARIRQVSERAVQRDALVDLLDRFQVSGTAAEDRQLRAGQAYRNMVMVQAVLMDHPQLHGGSWDERLREACAAAEQMPIVRQELATIKASRTWRYTAPLRTAVARLRRSFVVKI